jgi:uncharacterized damage-inducible protein DinB
MGIFEFLIPYLMTKHLIHETLRRIGDESIPRIKTCLDLLDTAQIWFRPYAELPSIGNLVLHVHGNARQWILHTLCEQTWERHRDWEFSTPGPIPTAQLIGMLEHLDTDLRQHLPLLTAQKLNKKHKVQVFEEYGVAILVHAIEHFSYHTGQIARDTKRFVRKDLGFYKNHLL